MAALRELPCLVTFRTFQNAVRVWDPQHVMKNKAVHVVKSCTRERPVLLRRPDMLASVYRNDATCHYGLIRDERAVQGQEGTPCLQAAMGDLKQVFSFSVIQVMQNPDRQNEVELTMLLERSLADPLTEK